MRSAENNIKNSKPNIDGYVLLSLILLHFVNVCNFKQVPVSHLRDVPG